jgi:dTDP-4-amino-4,6-dideoxygalactose transaminase
MGTLRRTAKFVGRQTIGRLPRSSARIRGPLAIEGGEPVRDVRFRPWPSHHSSTLAHWVKSVGPAFRTVFLSGAEGLPQARQKEFAARWAAYCGCRHGLLLPHGTDALRLALAATFDHDGLEYGGEVIVPNLSFIATATAALDRRFGVAFVDVDPGTLNIDPAKVEAAIVQGKTRAIMPVHQFGQPADMTALTQVAARHGLKIIEDAAQAHGAAWATGPVGSLGDAAAFSFQSAKNLASGEGGILTTNDTAVFERAYSMHNAGRTFAAESRWVHDSLGWNIRPTEYQAVLLLDRLDRFDAQQAIRAANFAALHERLAGIEVARPLDTHVSVRRHGMYMFVLRYQPTQCGGLSIDDFVRAVQAEGVPLQRCYEATLSSQVAMQTLIARRPDYVRTTATPVADRAVGEIVYLASNLFLGSRADVDDIADALRKVQQHYQQRSLQPS